MSLMRKKCCCGAFGNRKGCNLNLTPQADQYLCSGPPFSDCNSDRGQIRWEEFPSSIKIDFSQTWVGAWNYGGDGYGECDDLPSSACEGYYARCRLCYSVECPPVGDGKSLNGLESDVGDYSVTLTKGEFVNGGDAGEDGCVVEYEGTYTPTVPSGISGPQDSPGTYSDYRAGFTESNPSERTVKAKISVGNVKYGRNGIRAAARIEITDLGGWPATAGAPSRNWIVYGPDLDECGLCRFPIQTNATALPFDFSQNQVATLLGEEDDYPSPTFTIDTDPIDCEYDFWDCPLCPCLHGWFDNYGQDGQTYETTNCSPYSVSWAYWEDAALSGLSLIGTISEDGCTGGQLASGNSYNAYSFSGGGVASVGPSGDCITTAQHLQGYCGWTGPDASDLTWNGGGGCGVSYNAVCGRAHTITMSLEF